jgi:hypothetical protein
MAAIDVFIASTGQAGVVGRLLYEFNTEFETPGPRAEEFAARFKFLLARTDMLALLSGTPAAPTGLAFLTLRPTPYYDGPWPSSRNYTSSPACAARASAQPPRVRRSGDTHQRR